MFILLGKNSKEIGQKITRNGGITKQQEYTDNGQEKHNAIFVCPVCECERLPQILYRDLRFFS